MFFSDFGIVTPNYLSQESLQSTINIDPEGEVNAGIVIHIFLLLCKAIPSLLLPYCKELHDSLLQLLVDDVALKLWEVKRLFINLEGFHVSYGSEELLEVRL